MEGASYVSIVDLAQESVDAAVASLREITGGSCHYSGRVCDVSDTTMVANTWEHVAKAQGGRIDILVQAAGIVGTTNVKTEDVDPENFDSVFRVNVRGIFNGCKAVLPIMRQNGYGRIVNIASIAGKEGNAGECIHLWTVFLRIVGLVSRRSHSFCHQGMLAYSASKAAVIGLTKTIGKEYAETGITCNALAPAVVRTKMVEDMPVEQVKYMTDKIPMKRCGSVDEVSNMVSFIASQEASFTTGFCFDATGGRSVY